MLVRFHLNGRSTQVDVVGDEMLQAILRGLGMTSSRLVCGVGVCGACTVHLNGESIASCILPVPLVDGQRVETIEAVDLDDRVVQSFSNTRAFQCGYCTPGAVMEARALLADTPCPSRDEVRERMAGNLCRCGCYTLMEDAVLAASQSRDGVGGDC